MAAFDLNTIETERPIFELFRSGPVALFHKAEVLQETVAYLGRCHYIVHEFDCSTYQKENDILRDVGSRLSFPYGDNDHPNLDSFNDSLEDVQVPMESGLFLVFTNFDSFHRQFPRYAHQILEIIADHYRDNLLFGRRFMALVQSNDPMIQLDPVGARPPWWNRKEWLTKDRTCQN